MHKILFIGGVADGKYLEDPGTAVWRVALPVEEEPPFQYTLGPHGVTAAMPVSAYFRRLINLQTQGWSVPIYVEGNLSANDVLMRLINSYSPPGA